MTQPHLYDLVYAGAVLDGFSEGQVKANFGKHLKLTEQKVDKLFTGKRITLKKAIEKEKALQWQQKLLKIGAETVLVPAINSEQMVNPNSAATTGSLFDDNPKLETTTENKVNTQTSARPQSSSQKSDLGNSQQEYDEEMQKRIARAQALIAAQQMEQQSGKSANQPSMKRLWIFCAILFASILFLYFYVESIA